MLFLYVHFQFLTEPITSNTLPLEVTAAVWWDWLSADAGELGG